MGWIVFLGWFNFSLLLLNSSLLPTRWFYKRYNKKIEKFPWDGFKTLLKFLARVHPFTGGVLLITALVHGYLATGGFIIYSGSLVFFGVLAQFIVFLLGKYVQAMKSSWRRIHGALMFLTWGLFLFHVMAPYSIWIPLF